MIAVEWILLATFVVLLAVALVFAIEPPAPSERKRVRVSRVLGGGRLWPPDFRRKRGVRLGRMRVFRGGPGPAGRSPGVPPPDQPQGEDRLPRSG